MFVDGKSIRIRAEKPDAPDGAPFDPDFREKYTRPLSRKTVMHFVTNYAARRWARETTTPPVQIQRRLRQGARVPIRPVEVRDGTSIERALRRVRATLRVCFYCGAPSSVREIQTDHAIPRVRGGPDCSENRLPACRPCNQAKYDRTFEGFRTQMAGKHDTAPPTFFGETDFGRRVVGYQFDPDNLPDAPQVRVKTSQHLGL